MSSGRTSRVQPRAECSGEIQSRQRALSHDHGMDEFHRDMLCVGGVGPAPEGQQPSAAQKALRHFAGGARQPWAPRARRSLERSNCASAAVRRDSGERGLQRRHGISRSAAADRPPACRSCAFRRRASMPSTVAAGCSRTSPMMAASSPPGASLQRVQRRVGELGRDHRQELAFVGDVQRIEPQQFACAANGVAHRNPIFEQHTPRPQSRASSFSEVATPPRVGSRIQRMPGRGARRQRFHQRQHGAACRNEDRLPGRVLRAPEES